MTTTDLDVGATLVRPKSLTASSLIRRALIGIAILTGFILLSAVLYDANTTATANSNAVEPAEAHAVTARH